MKDTRTVLDVARDREAFKQLLEAVNAEGYYEHEFESIEHMIGRMRSSNSQVNVVLAFLLEREWQRSEAGR